MPMHQCGHCNDGSTDRKQDGVSAVPADAHLPSAEDRAARNAAFLVDGTETGFWNDAGVPALWPDDIDEWQPVTRESVDPEPGEPSF